MVTAQQVGVMFFWIEHQKGKKTTELIGVTSTFPDGEVESGAGLRRDAEVHRGFLSSVVLIDGLQVQNHLYSMDKDGIIFIYF